VTLLAPTTAQIKAQVEAIVRHDPTARALGIWSPARQSWPDRIECGSRTFVIAWCESSLAARAALITARDDLGIVLLTDLAEAKLGDDVLARLAKARLLRIESWEMVCDAFQARNVDPRIAGKSWIADILLDHAHRGACPPVAGGLLDADTAWFHLLDRALGLPAARPDADTLLGWTVGDGALSRFAALAPAARKGIIGWLAEAAGPVGGLITACLDTGFGADALALGLVAGVIFGDSWPAPELTIAAVRLEPFFAGQRMAPDQGRAYATAAMRTVRSLDAALARSVLERADTLVAQVHAVPYAASSPVLPSGFEARLVAFATRLAAAAREASDLDCLRALDAACNRVLGHDQAQAQKGRAGRVSMAVRLVRWLGSAEEQPASFADAAAGYSRNGAFVDRARLTLAGGDELAPLSTACTELLIAVRSRRERENETFARLLRSWNVTPAAGAPVVPVERILDEVVAGLAGKAPVLLLVMDGLSLAVLRELEHDFVSAGWNEMLPADSCQPLCGVAMLPTVTGISRASLLSGKPARGGASTEKAGFADHPALRAVGKAGQPPVLFHKAELSEGGALSPIVRETLGNVGRRVVGIVYNAIDDHLDGSDQLRLRWTLDDLRLLRPILFDARNAGRVVIVTADHGHVLDAGTEAVAAGDGDRWRRADGRTMAGELEFANGRVRTPTDESIVILPWSERLRYAMRKNGYHGGASPQEVLVPLAVLSGAGPLPGWTLAPPSQPEWWDEAPAPVTGPPAVVRRATPASRRSSGQQPTLFDAADGAAEPAAAVGWVDRLLASPTYSAQKQLAARGAPRDEDVRRMLEGLAGRGGKLGQTALAQRLAVPQVRIRGLIMAVRRVLNVDQSPVLDIEEGSGVVVLNRDLLDKQFELK
jgi:hypothetical protein